MVHWDHWEELSHISYSYHTKKSNCQTFDSESEHKTQKYGESKMTKNSQSPKLKTGREYLQYKTKGWHKINQ